MENQSIAEMENSLFKIQYGYFPESSYNLKVHKILDKFEPTALHYFEDESNEISYKHFDICKSYPTVFIRNQEPIPLCSIRNKIKDLEQKGKLYIEEVILDKYNCNFRIESQVLFSKFGEIFSKSLENISIKHKI